MNYTRHYEKMKESYRSCRHAGSSPYLCQHADGSKADNSKVVTLGANLSDEQKKSMYEYSGPLGQG